MLTGRCMRAVTSRSRSRWWTAFAIATMPAAIRERLLDSHFHPPQRADDHWENEVFDDIGTSGLRVLRRYCPSCGSPLTTEPELTPEIFRWSRLGPSIRTNGSIRCGNCSSAGAGPGSVPFRARSSMTAILTSRRGPMNPSRISSTPRRRCSPQGSRAPTNGASISSTGWPA